MEHLSGLLVSTAIPCIDSLGSVPCDWVDWVSFRTPSVSRSSWRNNSCTFPDVVNSSWHDSKWEKGFVIEKKALLLLPDHESYDTIDEVSKESRKGAERLERITFVFNHLGMSLAWWNSEGKSINRGFISCKEKNTLQLCRIISVPYEPGLVSAGPRRKYVHQSVNEGPLRRGKRTCVQFSRVDGGYVKNEICRGTRLATSP